MERPRASLPGDPERLKSLLADQQRALAEKDDALARSTHQIELLESKLAWFEEQWQLARHKRFGASSEESPDQASLFNEAEALIERAEPQTGTAPRSNQPKRAAARCPPSCPASK